MAIYKRGREFELWATEKQIQEVVRAGFEPGTAGLRVLQAADHSATLPPCLAIFFLWECDIANVTCFDVRLVYEFFSAVKSARFRPVRGDTSPPQQIKPDQHGKLKHNLPHLSSPRTQRHARLLPKDEEDKEREQKDKSPGTAPEVIYF